ncbi:unnamed protein product [Oikopleura dioica]|uniref:Uncharacterized protein n=1 Tax=Oikopleura dioica TaxID=34765 RepID=E4YTI6_OIKDI|nr:unnamed protein product [Oikopleura dioica]
MVLHEAYPKLSDVGTWLRTEQETWTKLSLVDFSPKSDFEFLILGYDDNNTLGEGLTFDEKARPDVFRDVAFLRDNYALTSIVTKKGIENLVLIKKNLAVATVLSMADALNIWMNPDLSKTEGAWKFPQEGMRLRKTILEEGNVRIWT